MNKIVLLMLMTVLTNLFAKPFNSDTLKTGTASLLIFTAVENPKKAHKVTPQAYQTIEKLGQQAHFKVEISDDPKIFTEQSIQQYNGIIFLNTRGHVLDERQKAVLQTYIRNGGGISVVHAALLAEEKWEWFNQLVGTKFKDHPEIQSGMLLNVAPDHAVNVGLPRSWQHSDEWYNYQAIPENVTVLLTVDESSYEGGTHGDHHPVAWYHDYDGGRVFYTAMGHTEESWKNELFLKHLLNGIKYVSRLK